MSEAHISIYKVVSFLGEGTYGQVYEVRETTHLGRTLALKVLRLNQFTDKPLARFFEEAERIAKLQHPYVLPIYNFGQLEDGRPYYVMELAPKTIKDLFRKRQALAEELVPYLQQTAEVLYYIHYLPEGIIHQDIKPGNLLIGRDGKVRLSDFGTTLDLGSLTHKSIGESMGSGGYMSPEQWKGKPRRDSDQYALAITCYQLLTGHLPFEYPSLEQLMDAHLTQQRPSPLQWNSRIPVEVAAVLLRAMAIDYRYRYHSVLEFAESYKNAVELVLKRYVCQQCENQNPSSAQECSFCGTKNDNRCCPYCYTTGRLGQRCCARCGRLTTTPITTLHNPFLGLGIQQGRYVFKRILKNSEETKVIVAVASDTQAQGQKVVLKRWECNPARYAQELVHYASKVELLTHLQHPLMPRVLDCFPDETFYYLVMTYIDGETLEERLQKQLRPLPEREVINYMINLVNILLALEQQQPPLRHYDISPGNIIIESTKGRACLTGFRIPPPPTQAGFRKSSITKNIALSPYLPVLDTPNYDQRTCIYMLAASMHHALTNFPPPHYPEFPPISSLNPTITPAFEMVLSRALKEKPEERYQSYIEMQKDAIGLLKQTV